MSVWIGGVEVRLSFWFFFGAFLLLWADQSGLFLLLFGAVALHEGGHLFYMRLRRMPLARADLTPVGLILHLEEGARVSLWADLGLNLAGCAANFAAAALFLALGRGGMAGMRFSAVNAALGIANLLPVRGLDGAQALEDALCLALGWEKGERVFGRMMAAVSLTGAAACLWVLLARGFSLPALCLLFVLLSGFWTPKG